MSYNVPEDEKQTFNKQTQKGLVVLAGDIGETLARVKNIQPETLVEAYNKPVQAPVTRDLTPLERYVYEPQPVEEVADLTAPVARESMVTPQEEPRVVSNFVNQAQAQFGGDMVSITPYEQAVTDIVGAEVDSLRNDAGEIASSPLEVFAKPLDANKIKALGFVDGEGKPTERGKLFFHLKNSGVFNEDGTITEKGQAYLMPRNEIGKQENIKAFKTWYDDYLDEPMQSDSEIFGAVYGFGKNFFGGLYNLYQTKEKLTNPFGLLDIVRKTAAGKQTIAELKTDQIASLEQIAKNFQNIGGYADIIQGLTGRALYEGASAATGVPMQEMKDAAEENLYLARQRQWQANENLRDLEVGEIAEAITGLDGFVKMADEAKATLGEEQFNQRYAGTSAITEMVADPANLIPAGTAFKIASSAPIASRAILKAQQTLGKVAQVEQALNKAQTIVEAGNTILKKEAVAVPLAQKLFTDISARAGSNPELLARAQQALDAGRRITAGADEVRAAMPNAIASVDELAAKRASLATRIPEEYAKKVLQTAELGAKIRSAPAKTVGAILERTGSTLTKVDNAVTGFFSERGLDQAYNAALGAAGVVGLAGNPIVGTIGAGAAALKAGKFITEYGKIFKYVGKEMERARSSIPFWKRVGYHTAPKSLGQGLSHAFNIFELGGATSDILRRVGRGIVAAYPSDLFFEYLSDGGDMRPQTMTRAAAESLVIGGSFAAGGGAFMGTNKRMREIAINDEINFRQGLVDTDQKARFEALPPVVRRSLATYSMANPTLNYNFIESGSSGYEPNTNTANININSTNPLKALVAHETLHHTIIKNNMEGGIAAMFLGDTKTNSAGGLFRSKSGKLDPEFEAFTNNYYDRLRAGGMTDAEIKIEYPLEKVAVEYFIEQHSDQYAAMAESGELGAIAARGEVRKKLGSVLETILPKIPVLRDLHFKSGGAIDANGAFVKGVGILGDDGLRQNPIANRMFKEMNRRSSGMMPGQFEPLLSDKEGSGAPLFFDPANEIDMELLHPLIQMDANDKPILKDGRPIALSKEVDMNRAIAGLSIVEAYRNLKDNNYAPEKGEAYVDDDGEFQPGWISDRVLTQMFAKHPFNNEQKRMIRQTNKMVKEGTGQRMVMINFPATTRNKAGKVVYKTQGATIRDTVPVAVTISKDGNILYGLMSVTKLQENIKKRANERRGKKLYGGNVDLILRDVQAMMDFHKQGVDSLEYFSKKYGAVEADQRKKFINTMFGLLNKKEQAVLNPMLLEDGVKSRDNVYRTYRADRVSKAIPMSPDEYAAMPFSYEAVSAVRMPEQRQMPEVSPEDLNPVANKQEAQGLWADGKQMFAINEMDEKLTPITSKAMLDSYPADAIGWMEPEQATEPSPTRFMPENRLRKAVQDARSELDQRRANRDQISVIWKLDQSRMQEDGEFYYYPDVILSEDDKYLNRFLSYESVNEADGKWYYGDSEAFSTLEEAQEYGFEKIKAELKEIAPSSSFGNDSDAQEISSQIFSEFPELPAITKPWETTKWGSWYLEFRDVEGQTQKISVRDHRSTRADMGLPDRSFYVSKQWNPEEVGRALESALEYIQENSPSQTRFMPEKIDADYMKAVESGDVEAQQRIVDEAARKANYTEDGYHITWSDFNEFRVDENYQPDDMDAFLRELMSPENVVGVSGRAFFFSPDSKGGAAEHNRKKQGQRIIHAKLKIQSPLVMDDDTKEWAVQTFGAGKKDFPKLLTEEARERVIKEGYDGILWFSKGKTYGVDSPEEIIVFNPEQIKSADPITRDDSGNIIPPSKRFDITSKDLRFMPEGESKESDKNAPKSKNGKKTSRISRAQLVEYDEEEPRKQTKKSTAKGNSSAIANAAKLK